MPIDPKRIARWREELERQRQRRERAIGAADQLRKQARKEFGAKTEADLEALVARLGEEAKEKLAAAEAEERAVAEEMEKHEEGEDES